MGDQFCSGLMCCMVPVVEDWYVRSYKGAGGVEEEQAIIRVSMHQRLDYWCLLCRPSQVRPVATHQDEELWRILGAYKKTNLSYRAIGQNLIFGNSRDPWGLEMMTVIVKIAK